MFWLFKRKKVADKKAMTPCVCDNGNEEAGGLPDAYSLQDFGGSPDNAPSSRLTLGGVEPAARRGGYQRLLPQQEEEPAPPPVAPPPDEGEEESCSSSDTSESSSDCCGADFFADTDDEEEELTCNVCERSFGSAKRLERHQRRHRHYGCCVCDSLFPGLGALEAHKEDLDHWSDYELRVRRCRGLSSGDDSEEESSLEEHRVYSSAPSRRRDGLKRLLL